MTSSPGSLKIYLAVDRTNNKVIKDLKKTEVGKMINIAGLFYKGAIFPVAENDYRRS